MPRLMIRCGASPASSAPSNLIEPEVGGNVPDSMLKIWLLPEPLGPIRPRISPRSTVNDTLLTALKPPKRFTRPSTASTVVRLFVAIGRARRQRQHGFALRLALRPHHIRLVVDILDHDREGALVLTSHLSAFAKELDAEAEHGAAFGPIDVQRRLAQRVGVDAAVYLDGARQHVVQEHVGVGGGMSVTGGAVGTASRGSVVVDDVAVA